MIRFFEKLRQAYTFAENNNLQICAVTYRYGPFSIDGYAVGDVKKARYLVKEWQDIRDLENENFEVIF